MKFVVFITLLKIKNHLWIFFMDFLVLCHVICGSFPSQKFFCLELFCNKCNLIINHFTITNTLIVSFILDEVSQSNLKKFSPIHYMVIYKTTHTYYLNKLHDSWNRSSYMISSLPTLISQVLDQDGPRPSPFFCISPLVGLINKVFIE